MLFDEERRSRRLADPFGTQRDLMRYQDKHVRPAIYAGLFGVVLGSIGAVVLHVSIVIGAIAGFVVLAALVLIEPSDGGPTPRR
jgi:hypothetical protein